MCFSAEADLVMGVVITGIGIDTIRHVREPAQRPLAALPLVLGLHQLTEAVVWWGLEDRVDDRLWRPATVAYLLVAFCLLPVLLPVAVSALDPGAHRRRMQILTTTGVAVALVLTHAVARGPVDASIDGYHVAYEVDLWLGGTLVALYVLVTCGSLLASDRHHVRVFGAVNLVAVVALAVLAQNALISLWCAWAAVTSVAIALHLRYGSTGAPAGHRAGVVSG